MPRPTSYYRDQVEALGPSRRRICVRTDKLQDLQPIVESTCSAPDSRFLITAITGSRAGGTYYSGWTTDPEWVRHQFAGIRGLQVWLD